MANPQEAWFAGNAPKVDGYEAPECPHGFLRFDFEHNRYDSSYRCTECDKQFVVRINLEEE